MKAVSGKEVCRLLERNGWYLVRVHGSHHLYGKLGNPVLISVPVHGTIVLPFRKLWVGAESAVS